MSNKKTITVHVEGHEHDRIFDAAKTARQSLAAYAHQAIMQRLDSEVPSNSVQSSESEIDQLKKRLTALETEFASFKKVFSQLK